MCIFSRVDPAARPPKTHNAAFGVQVTFYFFHWTKGSPDEFSQGEWNGLTFWEQLDAGVPWTKTKKFLMIVPTVL